MDRARQRLLTPPPTENVFSLPVDQLTALNGARVRAMIAAGERDETRLLAVLGRWPETWPADVPIRFSFLGICLTFACDMAPRCVYCNQRPVTEKMTLADWKGLVRSLGRTAERGTYVFLSGGEPLILGSSLWGIRGLVRAATRAGAACNLNTNALRLTPRAALGLVSSGLSRVHISLDTHRPEVQDALCGQPGRWRQVVRGIHNLQIAKALLGVVHPTIHVNCVLTSRNAADFPEFLRFLLAMKPLVPEGLSPDFDLHLIPVGGEQNQALRLNAAQYEHFFSVTWEAAEAVWQEYLAARALPADQRRKLHEKQPFLSPYHRVEQAGSLAEWAESAARGEPAGLALRARCYVAPTQAFVLPDGSQYWCGGHAIARPTPVGNVLAHDLRTNLRASMAQMADLPGPHCRNCPGATLAINQTVETRLLQRIGEWLNPDKPAEGEAGNVAAFE